MKIVNLKNTNMKSAIAQAAGCLRSGGLVIYPTETVYGAGVDAASQQAVNKLLTYKSRREGKPLSIAVNGRKMAADYVNLNPQAEQLYQQFLPGPYTIISESKAQLAQGVASEFGTLGVRWPDHPVILKLVKALGRPITATSANASGKKRPYTIDDILNNLSKKQQNLIDLVLDAGRLKKNPPSTVIDTTFSTPITVRQAGKKHSADIKLASNSEQETKQIAGKLMLKYWQMIKEQGLAIGLNGQLGAGKTIFAKGIADFLKISQTVTSPTYTYIKEYPYQRHQTKGNFYHLDMWKIDSKPQLETLELPQLLRPNNLAAIEWWSQIESFAQLSSVPLITINFEVESAHKRKLLVKEQIKPQS